MADCCCEDEAQVLSNIGRRGENLCDGKNKLFSICVNLFRLSKEVVIRTTAKPHNS